jgi:mono/diheme cytochrome c family protein
MSLLNAASKRAGCFALVWFVLLPELALAAPRFDADVLPYVRTHCLECHGPEKQKGGFRIDELSPKVGLENAPQWAEVIERISSGEMPPKKVAKQPTPAENAAVVEWLAARLREGQAARMAKRSGTASSASGR